MNIKKESAFKSFYNKLAIEGILKSVMLSSVFSLSVVFVTSAVLWFFDINSLWIAIAIYFGVTAILSTLFYFKKYRPTANAMAKRIDALGLEERILTMSELENDESYIALKQRENAMNSLKAVNSYEIKFGFGTALIVLLCIMFCLSCGMTTANVLGAKGMIPNGEELIDDIINPNEQYYIIKYIPIDYTVYDSTGELIETDYGMIDGNEEQVVAKGENGETVVATADPDYEFVGWSGVTEGVERTETGVLVDDSMFDEEYKVSFTYDDTEIKSYFYQPNGWFLVKSPETGETTIYVFAFFRVIGGNGGGGEEGDSDVPNDEAEVPPEDSPDNENQEDNQDESGDDGDESGGNEGGKSNNDKDKIIDGNTDYHERKDEYVKDYEERKANGEEIPDWLQKIIDDYYKLLN